MALVACLIAGSAAVHAFAGDAPAIWTREQLAAKAAVDRELTAVEALLDQHQVDPAAQRIAAVKAEWPRLRARLGGLLSDPHPDAERLTARIWLAKANATRAAAVLAPWSASTARFGRAAELESVELLAADTALALDRREQALRWYDALAGSTVVSDPIRVKAAHGCGRVLLATGDEAGAIDSFDFALRYGRGKLYNAAGQWNALFAAIEADLDRARRAAEIRRLGLDFVLFRDAERLRRRERAFARAQPLYQELLRQSATGAYSDASRVAQALCQIDAGKPQEGIAELIAFADRHPDSLHAGEALAELGRLAVDHAQDVGLATRFLERADAWLVRARQRRVTIDELPMRPAARPLAAGPKAEKQRDLFGNLEPVAIEPGMLLNQATCAWYLDDLEERVAMWRGFLALVQGDRAQAQRHIARLERLDAENAATNRHGSNRSRLAWGARHGYFYAYPDELALYGDARLRLGVMLADFAFITEDFARARLLAERILAGGFGACDGARRDYPRLLHSQCQLRLEGRGAAMAGLLDLIESAKHPFTRDRARYLAGNLALDAPAGPDQRRAIAHLRSLVAGGADGIWKWRAQLVWAQVAFFRGDRDEADAALRHLAAAGGEYRQVSERLRQDFAAISASTATAAVRRQRTTRAATASATAAPTATRAASAPSTPPTR